MELHMPKGFIKKISIAHGGVIDSIKFQADSTTKFGGKGGDRTDKICINYPNEYLTSISGTVGSYGEFEVVMSCFVTNKNRYGPYGSDTGTRFSYSGKGGIIVGFHGHVGKYLDAVGIYVMPKSYALARNSASKALQKKTPFPTAQYRRKSIGKSQIRRKTVGKTRVGQSLVVTYITDGLPTVFTDGLPTVYVSDRFPTPLRRLLNLINK
ncbi:hypothetical protein OSB04_006050 [Centaurea solstitialis]|uniref:Jacalin-type lectin domain-containing protein n=1 Tax=Centaurea solstitialis TaxID=347529 RepID=A0AA38TTV9_9ASTR|nr:hypothetical protein OSB04_006050 [Centaurea solstitialis]